MDFYLILHKDSELDLSAIQILPEQFKDNETASNFSSKGGGEESLLQIAQMPYGRKVWETCLLPGVLVHPQR